MKTPSHFLLPTFLSFIFSLSLIAQPTITQDASPIAGDIFIQYSTADFEGVTLAPGGENQVWDLSLITGTFDSYATEFILPSDLPAGFENLIPTATLADVEEEQDYTSASYYSVEADGFYIDGFVDSEFETPTPEDVEDVDPNILVLPFDFSYEDTRSNYYFDDYDYEVSGTEYTDRYWTSREFIGDGYGTLTTQAGTFQDVLRIKINVTEGDSTFLNNNGTLEFISADLYDGYSTYFFVRNESLFLLATVETDFNGSEIMYYTYFGGEPSGLSETLDSEFSIFPSPAKDMLTLDLNISELVDYQIADITGKAVQVGKVSASNATIDIAEIPQGLYLISLQLDDELITKRFVVER